MAMVLVGATVPEDQAEKSLHQEVFSWRNTLEQRAPVFDKDFFRRGLSLSYIAVTTDATYLVLEKGVEESGNTALPAYSRSRLRVNKLNTRRAEIAAESSWLCSKQYQKTR